MKILFLSDVHANPFALEAIERKEAPFDTVVCAGDLVDYGTHPCEVIEWMQAHHALVVLGNHDRHLLSITPEACEAALEKRQVKWAHDNYRLLSPAHLQYLSSLPVRLRLEADGVVYQIQHQYGPSYEMPESTAQFEAFWQSGDAAQKRLVFGHTHRRCIHMLSEQLIWMNPGSVSYRRPDDQDKSAHYMVVEDGAYRFGSVYYDRHPLLVRAQAYLAAGNMLETDLQDAFFFFGDAPTSRSPLPYGVTK